MTIAAEHVCTSHAGFAQAIHFVNLHTSATAVQVTTFCYKFLIAVLPVLYTPFPKKKCVCVYGKENFEITTKKTGRTASSIYLKVCLL